MRYLIFLIITITSGSLFGQKIEVIKYPELLEMINAQSNNTKVFNFWATWCGPCVKELSQFEKINEKYQNQNTEVVLVSFDFVEELESKVRLFVDRKKLKSKIYLLDETDYNAFIDKVDPSWSGAIPATLMVDFRSKKRAFFEKEFKENELEKTFLDFIN